MKKSFACSIICSNGIVGGAISIDDKSITYKTNKLTVDRKIRNLVLPLGEIRELSWDWIFLPIATLHLRSGEKYKFIIFNAKGFTQSFAEAMEF